MKKTLVLLTLAMMGFGGYVGYTTNYVNPTTANEVTLPRFVDIPRTQGFDFNINLNKNTIDCNSTEQGIKVIIERKDSIVYKTKTITKNVIKYVKTRDIPPFMLKLNSYLPKPKTLTEILEENKPTLNSLCTLEPNPNRIQH